MSFIDFSRDYVAGEVLFVNLRTSTREPDEFSSDPG
jgi:hypothetical protein